MKRKKGQLIPIETDILIAGLDLAARGGDRFHGFQIAKELRDAKGARFLTAHGTLYKALARLAVAGLLESSWEDPMFAAEEGRPRRRLYAVTPAGEARVRDLRLPARPQFQLLDQT
jgi:PadR family transcriptional regulator, regulatory protein PadR